MTVRSGKNVSFDYTLTVDGKVVDSSEGIGPLEYVHGEGGIIPGLSKELEGMSVNEEKTVTVKPEEAYGPVDPEAFQEVPKGNFPEGIKLEPGTVMQAQAPNGQVMMVKISEIKEDIVIVDFNHPFAGKDLLFDVKIVSIK
ncbi:MAG: peptidylprolyl isomerase [Candidatus Omnitrophota bacterium]|nr:peptidylprolyl isomerase [Candidatus Omnitrophota bacterium]